MIQLHIYLSISFEVDFVDIPIGVFFKRAPHTIIKVFTKTIKPKNFYIPSMCYKFPHQTARSWWIWTNKRNSTNSYWRTRAEIPFLETFLYEKKHESKPSVLTTKRSSLGKPSFQNQLILNARVRQKNFCTTKFIFYFCEVVCDLTVNTWATLLKFCRVSE